MTRDEADSGPRHTCGQTGGGDVAHASTLDNTISAHKDNTISAHGLTSLTLFSPMPLKQGNILIRNRMIYGSNFFDMK